MEPNDIVDGDEVFEYVRDLVALGPRRTGSEGGRAAAEYVASSFRSFGITDVVVDQAPSVRWQAEECSLTIGEHSVDAFPVAHSGFVDGTIGPFGTGRDGLTARLVDLDQVHGPADLRDAVVLFDVRFRSIDVAADVFGGDIPEELLDGTKFGELYAALPDGKFTDPYNTTLQERVAEAVEAGAAGFIAVLADYFDSNRYVNEDYGDLTIPGVWVTRQQATEIRERLAAADADATLVLNGSVEPVVGLAPVAVLPGASAETIVVHSHHDSAFDGAVQDASGTAVVLALAKHFASVPEEQRPRTLMFATMDTHFAGYESHEAFVAEHIEKRRGGREILVDISIEHVGRAARVEGDELVVLDAPSPRLVLTNMGAEAIEAIEDATEPLSHLMVLPTSLLPTDELPTDADLSYQAGVSVISLISAPVYLYDECDTLDVVDRSQLAPVASAFARIVEHLAVADRDVLLER